MGLGRGKAQAERCRTNRVGQRVKFAWPRERTKMIRGMDKVGSESAEA